MDGSVVLARLRQCAPNLLGPTRVQIPNSILIGSAVFGRPFVKTVRTIFSDRCLSVLSCPSRTVLSALSVCDVGV